MQDEFMRLQTVLHKTIVFITHDFDEAIRLADRIAIMKDGEIVQAGTPEDIVLTPATSYVAEFTRSVARAKVIRTRSLMVAAQPGDAEGPTVSDRSNIAEAAPLFLDGVSHLGVTDDTGKLVGRLDRDAVVSLMLQG
jgi:glycine betaine/proline transport system ATP-binding protein